MQNKILLLPVWAAICLGAPIPEPQDLGEGTTLSTRAPAQQTYTLVVPCYGVADCVPKTLTLAARDAQAYTLPSFSFPAVTRTHLAREPQVLGSPTRTVIVGPTPPATTKKTSSTKKTTSTKKPTSTKKTTSSTKKASSTKKSSSTKTPSIPTLVVTLDKRQSLGSPTREVWGWPWPTPKPTTSAAAHSTTRVTSQGDGTSRTASTTLAVPLDERQLLGVPSRSVHWGKRQNLGGPSRSVEFDKRQVFGSPSRTVLVSPTAPAPPHPHPTSIETVTVTVTYYPPTTWPVPTTYVTSPTSDYYSTRSTEVDGGSTRPASTTLAVPLDKRQTLGQPTRTVLVSVTTTVDVTTTKVSTVTQTVTFPTTIRTTVYQTSDYPVTTTERIISLSTATVRLPVTQTLTKSATSTLTTTTCTENTSTTIWDSSPTTAGPTDITRTATTTLGVPLKHRQELGGGIPSFSFTWDTGSEAAPTQTLEVVPRQVLGSASRSFTFDGSSTTTN